MHRTIAGQVHTSICLRCDFPLQVLALFIALVSHICRGLHHLGQSTHRGSLLALGLEKTNRARQWCLLVRVFVCPPYERILFYSFGSFVYLYFC
ncbi:hypothetical protein B0H19DRAFT_1143328 [Mycena capillaripes]|nr:hypothetical protein B0H19DRAFT_1143328 [Mycena capillaripes]